MGNISPRHSKSFHDGLNHHIALSTATTVTGTPNRSSWKRQLQLLNETLNIKKFSRRHTQGKMKRSRVEIDENTHPRLLSSKTAQNFHELMKNHSDKVNDEQISKNIAEKNDSNSQMQVKKSFSLFTIKQPLNNSTNKDSLTRNSNIIRSQTNENDDEKQLKSASNSSTKQSTRNTFAREQSSTKENQINEILLHQKRRHKLELTTVSNVSINKRHSAFVLPSYHLPKSQSQYYHPHHQIQLSSHSRLSNNLSLSTKAINTGEKTVTRKTIIQASTSELLRCLGEYLCSSCSHLLPILDPVDCIIWIKSADRKLVLQGWQEQVFVNPANIVFVYLLLRETLTYVVPSSTIKSITELHAIILTCLYLAFSYMGNEITYPLKPFVTNDETRDVFWQRVVLIMGQLSSKMLAINQNPKFFTECFSELKAYNLVH